MATNTAADPNKILADEEQGLHPQEAPPPYQAQTPNYGSGGEPVPPDYDQSHIPEDSPPSYESLYGQVKAAKQDSSGVAEFFKKFVVILLGTLGCTICVGLVLAIPVSMIAMGSYYLHDCPRERYIPIYLIVGGCFGVLKNLSSIIQRMKNRHEDQNDDNIKTNPFDGTVNCFLLAWFIAGNVWIYRIYNDYDADNPDSPRYCDPTLYVYSFWVTTAAYLMAALTCCCVCGVGLLAAFAGNNTN